MPVGIQKLFDQQTGPAPVVGPVVKTPGDGRATFQMVGQTASGSGQAKCTVHVSNDGTNFLVLGSITLALTTTTTSDGFGMNAPWAYIKATLDEIPADATVSLLMGV